MVSAFSPVCLVLPRRNKLETNEEIKGITAARANGGTTPPENGCVGGFKEHPRFGMSINAREQRLRVPAMNYYEHLLTTPTVGPGMCAPNC